MDQSNSQLYAKIQSLVQEEARKVATQVYQNLGSQFSVNQTPYHTHNNIDSPTIPAMSVQAFSPLGAVVEAAIKEGQIVNNLNPSNFTGAQIVPTLTVPVIYGNGVGPTSQFQGGVAQEGQIVLFVTPALVFQFWAYLDGGWHGADLSNSA